MGNVEYGIKKKKTNKKETPKKAQLTNKMLPTNVDRASSRLQTERKRGSDFKTP